MDWAHCDGTVNVVVIANADATVELAAPVNAAADILNEDFSNIR
jgi:hypothetical protein